MSTPQPPDTDRLTWLRATAPSYERALLGWPAIEAWFREVQFLTRESLPPTARTLRRWKQRRGLPVGVAPFGVAWTTTALLAAWCLSEEARRLAPRDARGRLTRRCTSVDLAPGRTSAGAVTGRTRTARILQCFGGWEGVT
jgi:hypothetical protein